MQAHDVHKRGADVFSRHDIDAFADLYASNALVNDPGYPQPLKGREAIKKDMAIFVTAFPDIQVRVVNSIVGDNNTIAAEWVMTGTNRGPIEAPTGSIPATNKPMELGVATFERLDGEGRIVEESRYYDQAGLFAQLGITQ